MHIVKWVTFNRLDQWDAQVELYEDVALARMRYHEINEQFHDQANLEDMGEVVEFIDGETVLVEDVEFSDTMMRERMGIGTKPNRITLLDAMKIIGPDLDAIEQFSKIKCSQTEEERQQAIIENERNRLITEKQGYYTSQDGWGRKIRIYPNGAIVFDDETIRRNNERKDGN